LKRIGHRAGDLREVSGRARSALDIGVDGIGCRFTLLLIFGPDFQFMLWTAPPNPVE